MAYMCMGCYEVYDWNMEMCPKTGCEGNIVEIDELMLPIIKMLNQKGYITEYCCSGHVYGNGSSSYICLREFVTEVLEENEINQIKEELPKSWSMEIDQYNRLSFRHMIYAAYEQEYEVEKYEDILMTNLEFIKFVEQLPELEY